MKKFLLIDGSSLLFRAHFALGRLSAPDGRESGALYGLLTSLHKAVKDYAPDFVAVVFDRPEPTFRHREYPDYKGNRPELPEGLAAQMPFVETMVTAIGLPYLARPGYEADDLIGTLARLGEEHGMTCEILTADKDLLQLVSDRTSVIHTKWENQVLGPGEVGEKFGVRPDQVVDTLALMGDASDNIPGVTGIGEKTAKSLITQFGSLDAIYRRLDELKGRQRENLEREKDLAYLSQRLARVDRHAPVEFSPGAFSPREPDRARCESLFSEWNFRTLREAYGAPDGGASGTPPAAAAGPAGEALAPEAGDPIRFAGFLRLHPCGLRVNRSPEGALRAVAATPDAAVETIAAGKPLADALSGAVRLFVADLKGTAHRFPDLAAALFEKGDDPLLMDALLRPDEPGWSLPVLAQSLHLPFSPAPAEEARLLARAAGKLRAALRVQETDSLYYELERPLLAVLHDMEAAGVRVDAGALKKLSADFAARLGELEAKAHGIAGAPFLLTSPKQLGEVLFGKLGLPVGKRTGKTKAPSTDAGVLEELAGEHEIARLLLEHRELSKLQGTYLDALPDCIAADGRIHTTFDPAGAATGRLSSRDPNMQNIPVRGEWGKAIRAAFVAGEGRTLLNADYSQIELRVMAHLARDEAMISAFRENRDIHTETAAAVFHVAPEFTTPEMRRAAKTVNFGILYGQGAFSLGRQIGVHPREAGRFIEACFARYPGVKKYIETTRARALDDGVVTTLMGRRRYFKDAARLPFNRREAALRQAVNATIQGSAADLMKVAMLKLHARLKAEQLDWRLLLQVHDELLLEGDPKSTNRAAEALREAMESAAKLAVPLVAEVHCGRTWAEAKG